MLPPIKIRTAQPADIAAIAEFNRSLAWETEQISLAPDTVWAGVAALFDDPSKGAYLVAEVRGEVVGQLLMTFEWSDWRNGVFWWIQSVYVRPDLRGQGIYQAMYEHILANATADPSVCGVRLYMESTNERARRAYEKAGMKLTHYQIYECDFVIHR